MVVLVARPVLALEVGVEADGVHREFLGDVLRNHHLDRFLSGGIYLEANGRDGKLVSSELFLDRHPIAGNRDGFVDVDVRAHVAHYPDHTYKTNGRTGLSARFPQPRRSEFDPVADLDEFQPPRTVETSDVVGQCRRVGSQSTPRVPVGREQPVEF